MMFTLSTRARVLINRYFVTWKSSGVLSESGTSGTGEDAAAAGARRNSAQARQIFLFMLIDIMAVMIVSRRNIVKMELKRR
jgi:hypothetical protein